MKVLVVFGTRPEAIKLAPVIRELRERSQACGGDPLVRVCITAQHREMLDQVLRLFGITPDYDLNVMEDHQTPTQIAAGVLTRLEPILLGERADWVLVQGDTTTVAAASLAAFYARVKVGHVEAGLRTGDKWQPFPEEINRRVAGGIADLHFAPTERARRNLLREGIPDDRIRVTGNPVIDALQWVSSLPPTPEVGQLLRQLGIAAEPEHRFPVSPFPPRSRSPVLPLPVSPRLPVCSSSQRIAARTSAPPWRTSAWPCGTSLLSTRMIYAFSMPCT